MRINPNNQYSNLMNSLNTKSVSGGRGTSAGVGTNSARTGGNTLTSQWTKGSASLDINSSTSVRKQMQDQLRNLFEKERSKTQMNGFDSNSNAVTGTENEEENKEDKLLNSGKVYNFKEVSNKIMRAKTSVSAGQAVVAAKRKISEIKRKLAGSDGDSDDLQLALTHARKMEVVAERKKNNLELEEMVKNTRKRDELLEKMEKSSSSVEIEKYEELKDEILDKQLDLIEEQSEIQREEAERMREKLEEKMQAQMEETMEQANTFIDEMGDEESEMLREMSEVIDAMEVVDPHMSEEDFSRLKTKHRLSEHKALMKADMEYLKSVFKNLDGRAAASTPGMGMSTGMIVSMSALTPASGLSLPAVDAVASDAPAPTVDVSV